MSGDELRALIGETCLQMVRAMAEEGARETICEAFAICHRSLEIIDGFQLSGYEDAAVDDMDLSLWHRVAPEVQKVLQGVHGGVDALCELFSDAEVVDIDADFDLDQAFDENMAPRERQKTGLVVDRLVYEAQSTDFEDLGGTIALLADMLRREFVRFGKRLQNFKVVGDRWVLLAELQEFRDRSAKYFVAVTAAILSSIGKGDAEHLLPRFRTEGKRAARLRASITDLSFDMNRFLAGCADADGIGMLALHRAMLQRVENFRDSPEADLIRAQDKREIVEFRGRLGEWQGDEVAQDENHTLHRLCEGFCRFLDMMVAINRRPELVQEDQQCLSRVRAAMAQEVSTQELMALVGGLYGRDPDLDIIIRNFSRHDQEPGDNLQDALAKLSLDTPAF